MHILILSETLAPGGAETFVVRLANALAANHEVTLAVMHGERIEPGIAAQLHDRVRLEALCLPAKRMLWKADGALRRVGIDASVIRALQMRWLRTLVAERRPDVIHSHLLHADRLASELRADGETSPRHVMTVHGDYGPYLDGQADPQMLRLEARTAQIVGRADAIVGVAQAHLDLLAERFPQAADKLHLVYNGYEPPPGTRLRSRTELSLQEDAFLFGVVARGVAQKGWREAVAAFAQLARPRTGLVLVGEGPAIEELRRRPLPEGVILAGFSASPVEFIHHFDVGLLPTSFPHESLPTVVMEYLYCGKPVIVTEVGETRAMIRDPAGREAGLLLPLRDGQVRVADLAAAMARMLDDPAALAGFQAATAGAFAKFDMGECARRCVELYRRVSGAPEQAAPRSGPATAGRCGRA